MKTNSNAKESTFELPNPMLDYVLLALGMPARSASMVVQLGLPTPSLPLRPPLALHCLFHLLCRELDMPVLLCLLHGVSHALIPLRADRHVLITDKKGAPQAWRQDAMFMSTWSLLISSVMCMVW